jgi:hypothetical protein
MMIRVLHNEGYYDYVNQQMLDRLIETEEIVSFYRQSGVAVLGVHALRSPRKQGYAGQERRSTA